MGISIPLSLSLSLHIDVSVMCDVLFTLCVLCCQCFLVDLWSELCGASQEKSRDEAGVSGRESAVLSQKEGAASGGPEGGRILTLRTTKMVSGWRGKWGKSGVRVCFSLFYVALEKRSSDLGFP